MELMEEDVKAADLVRPSTGCRSALCSCFSALRDGCNALCPPSLVGAECRHAFLSIPSLPLQVLWVGISFQQSASTVYFRKVRCWMQVSAADC